jgi:inorganic pyrophosphatase
LVAGTIVECEPAGLLEQIEDGKIDHKVLAVLRGETFALTAAENALRDFASHVFAHIPGKQMSIGRLLDSRAAAAYIRACILP